MTWRRKALVIAVAISTSFGSLFLLEGAGSAVPGALATHPAVVAGSNIDNALLVTSLTSLTDAAVSQAEATVAPAASAGNSVTVGQAASAAAAALAIPAPLATPVAVCNCGAQLAAVTSARGAVRAAATAVVTATTHQQRVAAVRQLKSALAALRSATIAFVHCLKTAKAKAKCRRPSGTH